VKLLPRKPVTAESNVGRGIEFALAIALFLGLGYLFDSWLGTKPVFMIIMFFVGVIGEFAALWYRYEANMSALDQQRADGNHRHHSSQTTTTATINERGAA
jgi:F0F1-type ATP synthase assembly protein I